MKTMLGRSAILAAFAIASPALAGPVLSDGVDGARSSFDAAVRAHASKALTIANQIREREGLTDAQYVNLGQALLGASSDELEAAAMASTYKGALAGVRSARSNAKALGNTTTEFVFHPITPCRLLDTRANGIRLTAMTPYGVDWAGGNPGNVAGCTDVGVAAQTGNLSELGNRALMINLTVTGPLGPGYIAARPSGATAITSNQNFVAGQDVANMAVVQDSNATGFEFELLASVGTHAVVDVLGVFGEPRATPLSCTTVVNSVASVVNGGSFSIQTACPAGYTWTGAGSNFTVGLQPFTWWQVGPNVGTTGGVATGSTCRGINSTGSTTPVYCYATCCRVPGR